MTALEVIKALAPVAASIAQTAHPTPGAGKSRLGTATMIIQQALQVIAVAGAIAYPNASAVPVIHQTLEEHVAEKKKEGGVPTL